MDNGYLNNPATDGRLKPCPFCGERELRACHFPDEVYFQCETCTSTGPNGADLESAVIQWNTRWQATVDIEIRGPDIARAMAAAKEQAYPAPKTKPCPTCGRQIEPDQMACTPCLMDSNQGMAAMCPRCLKERRKPGYGICQPCMEVFT